MFGKLKSKMAGKMGMVGKGMPKKGVAKNMAGRMAGIVGKITASAPKSTGMIKSARDFAPGMIKSARDFAPGMIKSARDFAPKVKATRYGSGLEKRLAGKKF